MPSVATDARLTCRVVIAGGGPAGMMTGYLVARAGIDVMVLEKHADFFRDFRGDTIHPSTMENLAELGLLDEFLRLPHSEVKYADGDVAGERVRMADFTHLPTRCKFIAFMPQWDFLNFIAGKAKGLPSFRLLMRTEAVTLTYGADGAVTGVRARSGDRGIDIAADLTIAADGRHSTFRDAVGGKLTTIGAPMDVMWFRLKPGDDHGLVLGRIEAGEALVMLDRGDYWQCALVIRKGDAEAVKAEGLAAFRAQIARLARRDNVDEIASLDDVKVLTVTVDRLQDWCSLGLLLIGDAAHAMSPIGGVGINLAIQDAVATANILAAPLASGPATLDDLRQVQKRRMFPTEVTQRLQSIIQNAIIAPVLAGGTVQVPSVVHLMQRWPWLQRLPARAIGLGIRPEHVRSPDVRAPVSR